VVSPSNACFEMVQYIICETYQSSDYQPGHSEPILKIYA
jgi:hypothetical protein